LAKIPNRTGKYGSLQHCAATLAVGLYTCATLSKLRKEKTNGNKQRLKARHGFHVSRKPVVHVSAEVRLDDGGDSVGLPHVYGPPILFAIARDSRTIFVSWSIDWQSVFAKALPVDREVHLRVYRADGLEEKSVAVEPMAAMHYVTIPGPLRSYHVEIGYYQPADVWHSVATSNEILIPANGVTQTAELDLATIPFHVSFQHLLDLFGKPDTALARVLSRFQKHTLSNEEPKGLTTGQTKTLSKLKVSPSEIAAAWRDFKEVDTGKLMRRTAFLEFSSTSPTRGFEGERASARS
jgi:hypothetical protein